MKFRPRVTIMSAVHDIRRNKHNSVSPSTLSAQEYSAKEFNEYLNKTGVHYYIRYVLTFASIFGVFPVSSIYRRDVYKLTFRWYYPMAIYSFLLFCGFASIEIFSLDYTIRNLNQDNLTAKGGIKKATSGSIFYGNACCALWMFIKLAKKWPKLMQDWRAVEISMRRFGAPRLGWKSTTLAVVLLVFAFTEHGLHNWLNTRPGGKDDIASMSLIDNDDNGSLILLDQSATFTGYLERFSLKTHWYLYDDYDSYNPVKGFLVMWLSLTATFLWNFTDLFIMLVSSALAAQFKKLTKSMHSVRGQMLTMSQWQEFRETYTSLTHLVKKIDDHINVIVALSIGSNIYFICAQLITEIDSIKHSYFRTLFYMYSFMFLVFRTTAVVMQASAINDESKKIVPEIFMCPTHSYSIETQRFLQEVTSDYVALTGLKMFSITRNFLLGVAGAVLTYEIVLIQLQNTN
ncbi:unnamed protein product [Macrosiphum euphorbiae]|uniref:Gustatory receptor n=1 Tax=Macrosiphum euphorbiae TaxID=13131 RepID=A0AAV0WZL5_9HEMI|nr:unnamed protein product [Macrosiphum euphorbiae]